MVATSSTMLPLGTPLPEFTLTDTVTGQSVSSADLSGPAIVVAFICNHCPYVKHIRTALADFGRHATERGVAMVAISSNSAESHPQDGPEPMAREARDAGYVFPYLFDPTQEVAKAFKAVCTPEFYVFGPDRKLAYRGQFDDSRPANGKPVTGLDLRAAVDALVAGRQPEPEQTPSIGCNIKWHRGQEPEYFR